MAALFLPSCHLEPDKAKTFLEIRSDTAWAGYDTLDITWLDSASGKGGLLFHGLPAQLGASRKVEVDGYSGQKIVVTVEGRGPSGVVYREKLLYDGAHPENTVSEVVDLRPPVGGTPRAPTIAFLTTPPVISIGDSVVIKAKAEGLSGDLKSFAWDFDQDGRDDFSGTLAGTPVSQTVTGGFRYGAAREYKASLRVVTAADSSARAEITVTVKQDRPFVDAGKDTSVLPSAMVRLHGAAVDTLGSIQSLEWKIGPAPFRPSGKDTAFAAPSAPGDVECILRAMDDDGQAVEDTLILHVVEPGNTRLAGLAVSHGRLVPDFSPADTAYKDSVRVGDSTFRVTPTLEDARSSVTVNGETVVSGQPSAAIPLQAGNNTVTVVVKSPDLGRRTYALQVFRAKPGNAWLGSLRITAQLASGAQEVALDPPFDPFVYSYVLKPAPGRSYLTLYPSAQDPAGAVYVNGSKVAPGSSDLAPIKEDQGTTVEIKVHAPDSLSSRTYTLRVAIRSDFAYAGGGDNGEFYRTVDRGQAWTTLRALSGGGPDQARGGFFLNPDTGYIAGAAGRIRKTLDGAKSWILLRESSHQFLHGMGRLGDKTVFAVGHDLSTHDGIFLKSGDAGATWSEKRVPGVALVSVGFFDDQYGLAAALAQTGAVPDSSRRTLYRTTDGGSTWGAVAGADEALSVHIRGTQIGYATGGSGTRRTADRGATWSFIPIPGGALAVDFPSDDEGVAISRDGARKTWNGGGTWGSAAVLDGTPLSLKMISVSEGCIGTARSLYWTSGAVFWSHTDMPYSGKFIYCLER